MRTLPLCIALSCVALFGCERDDEICGARPVSGSPPGPLLPGPCEVFYDVDGDSEIDNREVYRYDALDQEIERYTYYDGPQCNSAVLHLNEYEDGRQVRQRRDAQVDGLLESTTDYAYDEDGRLVERLETTQDADGTTRTLSRASLTYDDEGRLESESLFRGIDNARIQRSRFTYDEEGRLISEVKDGAINASETLVYDDAERVARREVDTDGDGTADRHIDYIYDGAGNPVSATTRSVDSGQRLEEITYDYGCW
ncbi:MAG: hypothetical protein ACE366_22490 [Bradymonadia bacterium]